MNKIPIILLYIAIVVSTLAIAAQCGPPAGQQVTVNNEPTSLRRIVDTEAGVVCFYLNLNKGVAMDCMPLSDTNLTER